MPKSAAALIALAVRLVSVSFFVQGLHGPKWVEHGLEKRSDADCYDFRKLTSP